MANKEKRDRIVALKTDGATENENVKQLAQSVSENGLQCLETVSLVRHNLW